MAQFNQCRNCTNYTFGLRCRAFPDGIPAEFTTGGARHDRPYPGQAGSFVYSEAEPLQDTLQDGSAEAAQGQGSTTPGGAGKKPTGTGQAAPRAS